MHKKSRFRLLSKAKKLLNKEAWEEAEKILLLLYENGERSPDLWLLYSQVLRGTNRVEEALRWIAFGARKYPNDLSFLLEEGQILLRLKKWEESLQKIVRATPLIRSEEDHLALATALYYTDHFEDAWMILSPFLERTRNGFVLTLAADTLVAMGANQEAIPLYVHALGRGGKRHHILLALGNAYHQTGQLKEAEAVFQKILMRDRSDIAATLGLGACMEEKNFYNKALALYQSTPVWTSGDLSILKQAGISALHLQKFELARDCFSQILEKHPPTPLYLSYFGYSLECLQRWEEAEEVYLQMIRLFPHHPHGYRTLAWIFGSGHSHQLTPDEGIAFAHKGLKLLPDPISWEILSACIARMGNYEKAYEIQHYLFTSIDDQQERARRQIAMRVLRGKNPLSDTQIKRGLVA
ncbi:MAG: tetratricopeptide repeat protein [Chlamydiia bacterium]|nr:tetratricopeptide repeat protein [Chlamydiia bacterium]